MIVDDNGMCTLSEEDCSYHSCTPNQTNAVRGIFIKHMEMPKHGCDHCFLRTGNYCGRIEKDESVVEYARKNERHPDCPLSAVLQIGDQLILL